MNYRCFIGKDALDEKEWSDFVFNNLHCNIFQSREIYDLYSDYKDYDPFIIHARDGNNNISGILSGHIQYHNGILKKLSSRAVISGGPIIKGNDRVVYNILLSSYESFINRKVVYTEVRNLFDIRKFSDVFSKFHYVRNDHLNYLVDLTLSESDLWKNVNSKRRNEIRRARKENVEVREIDYNNDLEKSYQILSDLYRNVKLPLPEYDFFSNAVERLLKKEMIRIFASYYSSGIIAVMFLLCYKDRVYNWYAASDPSYNSKYPNDLLPWEVMVWAKNYGYKIFDFGGAGSPLKKYGVRDYKKKFGGIEKNYGRFIRVHSPVFMTISKIGFKFWQIIKHN